jgi:MerR family transcriptional regulator, mercuric resistance operon regulatory protein
MAQEMTIGRLAKAAGVHVETIRYYQRRGLLEEPPKPLGGQRRYSPAMIEVLGFIRRAQQLGFSLEEVKSLLALSEGDNCAEVRAIAERKHEVLRARIEQLESMATQLDTLIEACRANKTRRKCPVIVALETPETPV